MESRTALRHNYGGTGAPPIEQGWLIHVQASQGAEVFSRCRALREELPPLPFVPLVSWKRSELKKQEPISNDRRGKQ